MAEQKKSKEELKKERDIHMAQLAIKQALTCFMKQSNEEAPASLKQYWDSLDTAAWQLHLQYFTKELKKIKKLSVKEKLLDLETYIQDCKKLVPSFKRSKEEVLLMGALGQLDVSEFVSTFAALPSNREKLDRKVQKQLKLLDFQDIQDLDRLDELTEALDKPKIKKNEIDAIEKEITEIDQRVGKRKLIREDLALRLVEWKSRGTIDIAAEDGGFRLDA